MRYALCGYIVYMSCMLYGVFDNAYVTCVLCDICVRMHATYCVC